MGFLSDVVEAFVPSNIESLYTEDLPQATAPDVSFQPLLLQVVEEQLQQDQLEHPML